MVHQQLLSERAMPMTIRMVGVFVLLFFAGSASANEFCGSASFVPMDQLAANKDTYLNKRVRSHAILRTDAKEFALLKQDEKTRLGLRITTDDKSATYSKGLVPHTAPTLNVKGDFFEKLRAMEGAKYRPDMTKIVYYRQDVLVCGRVVKVDDEYDFAIDDLVVERSYLLPWKQLKSK